MLVEIDTLSGKKKIRVCDNCKTVCIPGGRFCSGYCARSYSEMNRIKSNAEHNSANADSPSSEGETK